MQSISTLWIGVQPGRVTAHLVPYYFKSHIQRFHFHFAFHFDFDFAFDFNRLHAHKDDIAKLILSLILQLILQTCLPLKQSRTMTLQEFLDLCSQNPSIILLYFLCLPLTALLAGIFGKGEAALTPWKYLYSVLMFLACVPGIFAITLNVYLFLFERRSIFEADMFSQIVPILIMVLTLFLIRKNTCFEDIPGFNRLGGLLLIIGAVLSVMWFLDKTRIVIFSYMPFYTVLIILAVLFFVIRIGSKQLFK